MMRKIPRFVSSQISRLFSTDSLIKMQTPVFMPFYHVVSDEKLPHIINYNYRNISQFENELDFYLQYYQPVSIEELMSNPFPRKKVFHISFDDGLKECYEIIAPILLKKGIPASFFINTGFVNNRALFHKYKASLIVQYLKEKPHPEAIKKLKENQLHGINILKATILQTEILDKVAVIIDLDFEDFLQSRKPYLTTEQLIQLQNQGFTIGAHSVNHPEFWLISAEKQKEEIVQSVNWVKENVHPKIKTFAFPYSDFGVDKNVIDSISKEKICDLSFGTAGVKFDETENHFQRYPVELKGDFIENLKSELVYFALRKSIGQATVKH
ncbi:MAG: polysaccharide deacetylase family protein [Draconibacterium sp.]